MTDQYMISENGYFFTDINAPTPEVASYGDLNPPAPPPFTVPEPGVTTLDDGNVIEYEDDEMLMNYFVYDGNDKLVSYLETNKATGSTWYCGTCSVGQYVINPDTDKCQTCPEGKQAKMSFWFLILIFNLFQKQSLSY